MATEMEIIGGEVVAKPARLFRFHGLNQGNLSPSLPVTPKKSYDSVDIPAEINCCQVAEQPSCRRERFATFHLE